MSALIGLDFGTESTVAVVIPGNLPSPTENWDEPPFITCILLSDIAKAHGQRDVWELATDRNCLGTSSDSQILHGIKRVLAAAHDDPQVETYLQSQGLEVEKDNSGGLVICGFPLQKYIHTLIKGFEDDLSKHTSKVETICMTFPGYVPTERVALTQEKINKFSTAPVKICSEAEAIAAVYSFYGVIESNRRVAFANVGAGHSWVAVVYFGSPGTYEVLAEQGELWLGGDEFDIRIAQILSKKLEEIDTDTSLPSDLEPILQKRLLSESRMIKRRLSRTNEQVEALLPFLFLGPDGHPRHYRIPMLGRELESAVDDYLGQLQILSQRAISDAGLRHYDIDHLVLLGGQAQSPCIRTALSDPVPSGGAFGRSPIIVDPRKIPLAFGAALVSARNIGREGAPQRLSDLCGAKFPLLLRELELRSWPEAARLLSENPGLQSWPLPLQAKIVRAEAKVSLGQIIETLRDHGEKGIDDLIEYGRVRRSSWNIWPFNIERKE